MCYCIIISLWIHLFIFCVIVQYPVLWVSFACVAVHVIGPGRGNGHRVGIASPRYPIVISFPPLLKHIDVHCRSNDVKLWMISVVFSLPSILSPTTVVSSRWATRFSQLWSFNCILQPGNCCMSGWGWFYFFLLMYRILLLCPWTCKVTQCTTATKEATSRVVGWSIHDPQAFSCTITYQK